jgi:hypothetical protein
MQSLDTIHDYMALCCAPHNLKYVAMSVMLSSFMGAPSFLVAPRVHGHITCILG